MSLPMIFLKGSEEVDNRKMITFRALPYKDLRIKFTVATHQYSMNDLFIYYLCNKFWRALCTVQKPPISWLHNLSRKKSWFKTCLSLLLVPSSCVFISHKIPDISDNVNKKLLCFAMFVQLQFKCIQNKPEIYIIWHTLIIYDVFKNLFVFLAHYGKR